MDKITQRVKELEDLIQQRKGTKMLTSGEIGCLRNKLKGFKEGVAMERERVKEIIERNKISIECPSCDVKMICPKCKVSILDENYYCRLDLILQAIDSENKSKAKGSKE